jgi:hypothetical protein
VTLRLPSLPSLLEALRCLQEWRAELRAWLFTRYLRAQNNHFCWVAVLLSVCSHFQRQWLAFLAGGLLVPLPHCCPHALLLAMYGILCLLFSPPGILPLYVDYSYSSSFHAPGRSSVLLMDAMYHLWKEKEKANLFVVLLFWYFVLSVLGNG